ncbi:MAG: GntR family transcriptional regulator [Chitinivibrionales bacterium]|nr:GntR family transcriptional regulator [Chitinivibrionales bacterium]
MFSGLRLKKDGDTPAYKQIIEKIVSLVQSGKLKAGDKLPPERELAETLGVARGTVKKAYEELARDHVIEVSRGRGSFVSQHQDVVSDRRKDRAVRAIGRLIAELTGLRFSLREIKNLVDLKIAEHEERLEQCHVALVDCNPEALAIYERQVTALSRIGTTRLLLEQLRDDPAPARKLHPYGLIITTATHYAELCALLPGLTDRIIQAAVSPRQESIIELARISTRQRIGVISRSDTFLRIITAKLHDLHIPVGRISHLRIGDDHALAPFLTDRDIVIVPPGYSLLRRRDQMAAVQGFRDRGGKVIEFDYQIERGSLLQIEERIRALLNQ